MSEPNTVSKSTWGPALAYLAALSILAAVSLFFAPVALIVLMPIFLVAMAIVWARAGLRAQRWFWINPRLVLTETERSVWTSAVVIVGFGIVAIALAIHLSNVGRSIPFQMPWFELAPRLPAGLPGGSSSTTYGNADSQARFKQALEAANIPYKLVTRDGKEWVSWAAEYNNAVEKIRDKVDGFGMMPKRSVHFPDKNHERSFVEWLTKREIPHKVLELHGESYVTWEGEHDTADLMQQYMDVRAADCNRKDVAKAPATRKKRC